MVENGGRLLRGQSFEAAHVDNGCQTSAAVLVALEVTLVFPIGPK